MLVHTIELLKAKRFIFPVKPLFITIHNLSEKWTMLIS